MILSGPVHIRIHLARENAAPELVHTITEDNLFIARVRVGELAMKGWGEHPPSAILVNVSPAPGPAAVIQP